MTPFGSGRAVAQLEEVLDAARTLIQGSLFGLSAQANEASHPSGWVAFYPRLSGKAKH